MEWYVPRAIAIIELQRTLNVINQFLATPFDLDGKKVSDFLNKKRRRRRRRSPSPDSDADLSSGDEPRRKKRKEKKIKEKEQYKSAQFIQDSDEEYGDMDAFLEKERLQRERMSLGAVSADGPSRLPTMKATGTKKRRRKGGEQPKSKKRKGATPASGQDSEVEIVHQSEESEVEVVEVSHTDAGTQPQSSTPPVRPRPRPKLKRREPPLPRSSPTASSEHYSLPNSSSPPRDTSPEIDSAVMQPHRSSKRLIISDDDED